MFSNIKNLLVVALVTVALVAGAITSVASTASAQQAPTQRDIAVRDQLVRAQESLLNAYRCRFNIDTHAVPGGCLDGQPPSDSSNPPEFTGTPTQGDVAARDELISAQESLLNAYRCRFNIDTHIVPNGCPDQSDPPPTITLVDPPEEDDKVTPLTLPIPANPPTRIDAGLFHFCYLQHDHTAICVRGDRFHGQALTGAPGGQFAAISSGARHSCGLRATGTVECWGDDQFGPYLAPTGQFAAVSAGVFYSCGLRITGTIECWSHPDEQGNPTPANDARLDAPTGQFAAVSATAGAGYACGLRTDSTVSCWGHGLGGTPLLDAPNNRFTAISTGTDHACGLLVDGTLECWGVANPTLGKSSPPGGQFAAVAVGNQHSCALRANGTVLCWGQNDYGQANAPTDRFTEITAGGNISCGFRVDQTAVCWGAIKRPFEGLHNIHVFYCAAQSAAYSNADLQREVRALNDNVGSFFTGQSSGLATVNFVAGGVVSPNISWDQHKVSDLFTGDIYGEPCESEIDQLGDYQQSLVLVNLEPGNPAAFATIEGPTGLVHSATLEAMHSDSCSPLSASTRVRDLDDEHPCSVLQYYYYAITHEIGHTVFDLQHDLDCSVMSYNCIDYSRLGCTHLIALDWPREDQCERDQLWRAQSRVDFTSVQAGIQFYCGLRIDQTVDCWGANDYGQSNAPSGRFTSFSVHLYHACGLRTDGTIACWGRNDYGQTDAPSGTFTSVRTWRSYSCGVRESGITECWGDQTIGKQKSYTPGGQLTAISAGWLHWCALKVDQTIVCDGFHDSPATHPPAGTFNYVHANSKYSCGIKSDQTLVCWGESGMGQADPPAGQFTSLDSGWHHACGLRPDKTITCWYYDSDVTRLQLDFGQDHAPSGQFTAMSSGRLHACGLRTDQTITCWGHNGYGQSDSPSGRFIAIAVGGLTSCGLRTNQTITCWGDNDKGQADPPGGGQFTAIASSGIHSCALRLNKAITCWGQNASGEADAPSGQFIAVATGGQHSCGIRADRTTITCWGTVPE